MSKKVSFLVASTNVKNAFRRSNSLLRSSFKAAETHKISEEISKNPEEITTKSAEGQVRKPAKNLKGSSKRKNPPQKRTVQGYVGFANLPNQVHTKAVKRGFNFTVMVVGESGLGKSTLVNSMFLSDVYSSEYPGPTERVKKTVSVEATTVKLNENGVYLRLTVVDCPGFGDAVDNSNCWKPIIDYIETKYEDYLTEEFKVNRMILRDERVHCCLYFIQPSGHGLKKLDIESMKKLCSKVNLIPIIAKADTLTVDERVSFKKQILEEIVKNNIKIYKFPEDDDDDFDNSQIDRFPFAVVGSNMIYEVNGKNVRGRQYPWGIINVEDPEHCDFIALRNTLICTHMQDLIDVTNEVHYENYRSKRLASLGITGKITQLSNKNHIELIAEEKLEQVDKLKIIEEDLEKAFVEGVQQKMERLRILEVELQQEYITSQQLLETQKKELEERKKKFEQERENNPLKTMSRSNDSVDGKKTKLKNLFHKSG